VAPCSSFFVIFSANTSHSSKLYTSTAYSSQVNLLVWYQNDLVEIQREMSLGNKSFQDMTQVWLPGMEHKIFVKKKYLKFQVIFQDTIESCIDDEHQLGMAAKSSFLATVVFVWSGVAQAQSFLAIFPAIGMDLKNNFTTKFSTFSCQTRWIKWILGTENFFSVSGFGAVDIRWDVTPKRHPVRVCVFHWYH